MYYVQWFLLKSVYEFTDCAKIRFSLHESGWNKAWCPGLVPRRVPNHRNQWQEVEGLLFSPQNSQLVHILSFHSKAVVSLFIFPTGRQPSIPSPVEEDTSKIWYITGTVFIQGPSIFLPVWGCIMFNCSYLRACKKLRIVQKIRFSLHESVWTKAWSLLGFRPIATVSK